MTSHADTIRDAEQTLAYVEAGSHMAALARGVLDLAADNQQLREALAGACRLLGEHSASLDPESFMSEVRALLDAAVNEQPHRHERER